MELTTSCSYSLLFPQSFLESPRNPIYSVTVSPRGVDTGQLPTEFPAIYHPNLIHTSRSFLSFRHPSFLELCSSHASLLSSSLISVTPQDKPENNFNADLQGILLLLPLVICLALFMMLSPLYNGRGLSIVPLAMERPSLTPSPPQPVFVMLSSNTDRLLPVVFTRVRSPSIPCNLSLYHPNHFIKNLPQNFQEHYLY